MRSIDDAEYARDYGYTHGRDADYEADRYVASFQDAAQENADRIERMRGAA